MERLTRRYSKCLYSLDFENFESESCKFNATQKLGKLEDLEEQLGMSLLEFFSKLGKTKEYMVTATGKRFYPATLVGGEIRTDGKFVYCVLVHDVDNPFYDYFEKVYTREEAEKKLEEMEKKLIDIDIPKKPIYISEIKGLIGHYECPNCGHQLYFWQGDNKPNRVHKCCDDCGQVINWGINNEII